MYDVSSLNQRIQLPAILNIPPKLLPIIIEIDNYKYFLLEGGRGSAKSQSVARELLVLGEMEKLRIVCGREVQATIEESVYQILVDLIKEHNLNYRVYAKRLVHRATGNRSRQAQTGPAGVTGRTD